MREHSYFHELTSIGLIMMSAVRFLLQSTEG